MQNDGSKERHENRAGEHNPPTPQTKYPKGPDVLNGGAKVDENGTSVTRGAPGNVIDNVGGPGLGVPPGEKDPEAGPENSRKK
ncbi:hypothetical protein [Noviherbaspirillum massiliense]|uniref:hypothetical protein n=1 Tax=Noviherbaspirillum massiliense TaxID=1465823 RepID=UPI0002EEF0E8|nr:hypothetical protein [Noviherbaspirillum massiliense]